MLEDSPAPLLPAEESAEAETEPTEPKLDSDQFASELEGEDTFVCDCEEAARYACKDESLYKEHQGKRYCVLHYPGKEKSTVFKEAIQRKLDNKDFNFCGVWFPDRPPFNGRQFNAAADFSYATFAGRVSFSQASFGAEVDFGHAIFNKATSFSSAIFNHGASFYSACFNDQVHFTSSTVTERADFRAVTFRAWTEFTGATFNGEVTFHQSTFSAQSSFNSATFTGEAGFRSVKFIGGADFSSAVFSSEADFSYATFSGETNFPSVNFSAIVSFRYASFNAAGWFTSVTFGAEALFSSATFNGDTRFCVSAFVGLADFDSAQFNYIDFSDAKFQASARFVLTRFRAEAKFKHAQFSDLTLFNSCQFISAGDFSYSNFAVGIDFVSATIDGQMDFSYANFAGSLRFSGENGKQGFSDQSSLDLQHARIEKPDRIFFHTVSLRPHWFVNVDARKFDFTNVRWRGLFGKGHVIDEEIKFARRKYAPPTPDDRTSSAHRLLAIACWRLAVNAEENHRYDEASKLRFWAMDARRKERAHGHAVWELNWWYGVASGYGELTFRAFFWLIIVWFLFVPIYWRADFVRNETKITSRDSVFRVEQVDTIQRLPLQRALTYSLEVMALQKPEPRPATNLVRLAVFAETFLGPVQAALLVLAIRRKFMR